jgi:hypothetical protein
MRRAGNIARKAQRTGGGSTHLQIERLVLDGFPLNSAQAARLQSTVEQELGRMLVSTPAESWHGGATRQVEARPVHLAPGNSPAVLGRQIARTLFASLSPPTIAQPLRASSSRQVHTKS